MEKKEEKEATLNDVVAELRSLEGSIAEMAKWVRFQSAARLREALLKELDTPQKKVAFELTDGEHSRRDIAKEIGIDDDRTVRTWWDRWFQLAVVAESENWKGRPQKIVSLSEIGIEVPSLKPKPAPQPPEPPIAPPADTNPGGSP
jgi:hypothetical protein